MKANELMLGNLFTQKGSTFIEVATFETFELLSRGAIIIEGVTLIEDMLLRFGLTKNENRVERYSHLDGYYNFGELYLSKSFRLYDADYSFSSMNYLYVELKFAHQLQNLFFSLTGEKLTLKD